MPISRKDVLLVAPIYWDFVYNWADQQNGEGLEDAGEAAAGRIHGEVPQPEQDIQE